MIQKVKARLDLVFKGRMTLKRIDIKVVVDDSSCQSRPGMFSQHGFSAFVKAHLNGGEVFNVLFDAGTSDEVVMRNLEVLGIDPKELNAIVLSHGHHDHVGGLVGVLKKTGKRIPVIAHPDAFLPKFGLKDRLRYIGLPFKLNELEDNGGIITTATNHVKLAEGLLTTGEIERKNSFEDIRNFYIIKNNMFVEDRILDDQALIANVEGKGLVVITGCAHSGIINTIYHAKKITVTDKVHLVLGGFHLSRASKERIESTLDEFKNIKPKIIAPCHCTGSDAIAAIRQELKENCRPVSTGDEITI